MIAAATFIEWGEKVVVPLTVALIVGGPATIAAIKTMRENRTQHGDNATALASVKEKVENLDGKVDTMSSKLDMFIGRTEDWRGYVEEEFEKLEEELPTHQ